MQLELHFAEWNTIPLYLTRPFNHRNPIKKGAAVRKYIYCYSHKYSLCEEMKTLLDSTFIDYRES